LGDFDALVLGLFLIAHFPAQLCIPDFGFYGREGHVSLIREERLIAGVNFLSELSPKLRRSVLLIEEKEGKGTTVEDAETLAAYERILPECALAPALVEQEAEGFREPIMETGHQAEHDTANDDIVEVCDQEQAYVPPAHCRLSPS
jgi:hypothetical protein